MPFALEIRDGAHPCVSRLDDIKNNFAAELLGCVPRRDGLQDRFAAQALEHGARGREREHLSAKGEREEDLQQSHQVSLPGDGRNRVAVGEPLAERSEVRHHAEQFLRAAIGIAKAGDGFIEDEHHRLTVRQPANALEESRRGPFDIHRLHDHRGDLAGRGAGHPLERGGIVEGEAVGELASRPRFRIDAPLANPYQGRAASRIQ
jgi:hypothetical protein